MTADFHARSRAVFDAALDLPEPEREAYVRQTCADQPEIMQNVLELLGYHERNRHQKTQQPFTAMMDAVNSEQSLLTGRVLGRYELLELIGQGGMGRVYKARRTDSIGQPLALKLIRQEFAAPSLLDRFAAEREILARLNHPNIAHFIDAGSLDAETQFVAMELVDGLPLRSYLAQHQPGLEKRLNLFRQLLAAVAHAHRSLVVHRDIKPENVMIRADGVVKLLDFGIAKLLGDQPTVTQTGERMFTPLNAAPEQILGHPCDVTTDVYALGALLYELISGSPVYSNQNRTAGELERDVLKVPPEPMRLRRRDPGIPAASIPVDLENIVQKALRKEPDGRYRTVEQFDADVANLLAGVPVVASGTGTWYRTRKLIERHRLASALTVAIVATVLAALVVVLVQNRQVRAERDRATLALNAIRDAFMSADPDGYTGGDIRARQILRQTNAALTPLIQDDDTQTADLLLTLVEVQLSMGMLTDAAATLSRLPQPLIQAPRACVLHARLMAEQEQKLKSEQHLATCHSLSAKDQIQADLIRARVASKNAQFAEAASRFERLSQHPDIEQPLWVYARSQRAIQLAYAGQRDLAIKELAQAEAVIQDSLPADHPILARLHLARLEVFAAAGDQTHLTSRGPEICSRLRDLLGQDSILTGRAESLVGQAFFQDQAFEAALPHLRNAWETFAQVLGSNHAFTLQAEMNLAMALAGPNEDGPEAGPHYENVHRASLGPDAAEFHAFVVLNQAEWLLRQNRLEDTDAALKMLSDPTVARTQLSPDAQQMWADWQAYGYWRADCAAANGDYSLQNLCAITPAEIDRCRATHQSLCRNQDTSRPAP